MMYKNPIIQGFNPDPSICRVGNDFYIVNSSFEFYPGVPIYHSKNLVNWNLIGYCLTRRSQDELLNARASGGIYAPTIRYHNDMYYMTTTNVSHGGNFIVHAKDPSGPWSEPVWVDQGGIDPSLFFDDDGTVYYCSNATVDGKMGIALSIIDPMTGERLSPIQHICSGSGGRYPEGPHLYKINDWYYLMIAEGGTEYGHMETIFRSKSPWGPYEGCPHNPILSHRDRTYSPIQCTGHADMVEDQNGNWWLVCLGVRPLKGMLHNLGRETFLAPVTWTSDGWPIIGNDGYIEMEMNGPLPGDTFPQSDSWHDLFESHTLDLNWNFIRNPKMGNYDLSSRTGSIKIIGESKTLSEDKDSPSFIGKRQQHFNCTAEVNMSFKADEQNSEAGITAYYNDSYHYEEFLTNIDGEYYVCLRKKVHDIEVITDRKKVNFKEEINFRIRSDRDYYYFDYKLPEGDWEHLGKGMTAGLCTEGTHTMTFTGTYLGVYCVNGNVFFDWFKYTGNND